MSSHNSGKFLAWKHALIKYEEIKKTKIDYVLDLDCTNPIRHVDDINNIIKKKFRFNKIDAIVTIANSRKNPYFNMIEKNKKNFLKISKTLKVWPVRRQDAPEVYDQVASI